MAGLESCLLSLVGYGIHFRNRDGRLVIQSASYRLNHDQMASLTACKPFLLSILPAGECLPVGALLDALEAGLEREAIVLESGECPALAASLAQEQARAILQGGRGFP